MKKGAIAIIGLILIICLSFSVLGVNALNSDEWRWSSSGMSQTYYQGDSGSVTLTFYSSCPDQLQINSVSIQFDWMSSPVGYTLGSPVYLATNNQNTFTAISFSIPASESIGSHSCTIVFQGQQDYNGGILGIGNGWKSITATGTTSINVHDAYEKVYNQNSPSVSSALTHAFNANYRSPDAQALLQQAQSMYNQATSLANQGQWQAAVDDLNTASTDASQAAAKEASYVTPTPVPTQPPIPTPSPVNDVNPTPVAPEFPVMAILAGFLALSLVTVTLLTVRKRKLVKN